MSRPPVHVVPRAPGHGVALYAAQVAGAVGASTVDLAEAMALPPQHVHAHVTDRLYGASCEEAATRLVELGRRHHLTVTLHDVPQPGDGAVFHRRARAYAAVLAASAGWVVSSWHERALASDHLRPAASGTVVHLPVMPLPGPSAGPGRSCSRGPASGHPTPTTVVGVLGWVYPGKGHAEVVRAGARLPGPVVVRALGRTAPGHASLDRELAGLAESLGVGWELTGWVPDAGLCEALHAVDVPVAAHRNVSASGSINTWIAARRRPLVADGTYSRELDRLRPGTITLVDPAPASLAEGLLRARSRPGSTHLGCDVPVGPGLREVASAYLDWWRAA